MDTMTATKNVVRLAIDGGEPVRTPADAAALRSGRC